MLHNSHRFGLRRAHNVFPIAADKNSRRSIFWSVLAFLYLLAVLFSSPVARCQDQEELKGVPAEPTDAEEVRAQIAAVEKLRATLPDRGAALYYLAVSKQHLRETREALALLKECLALHEGFDPSGEPAFLELKSSKEFTAMIDGVHQDYPVVARAHEAFRTTEKDLVPEGLAYDAKRTLFYLSSLNRRKIVRISRDGISDFVPPDRFGLLPVLGIRLDPNDDTVWADSFTDSTSLTELLHFDATGNLLGRFKPQGTAKHGFNDLVVRKSGEVITTDSLANTVFRFDPAKRDFTTLPVHRPLFYPNGIALSGDDRTLYVADYLGVVCVDLSSGESHDVDPGARSTLAGVDGLYWYNGSLIAIQNGIGVPRIAAFHLASDGFHVTRTTVLENRSNLLAMPTTGAIRGSDFFFIANSQIENMNNDKVMDVTKLAVVRVGVLKLP
jgi:sugar lactone lactonase YvrE